VSSHALQSASELNETKRLVVQDQKQQHYVAHCAEDIFHRSFLASVLRMSTSSNRADFKGFKEQSAARMHAVFLDVHSSRNHFNLSRN
jgi:hypothetical protein